MHHMLLTGTSEVKKKTSVDTVVLVVNYGVFNTIVLEIP